MAFFSNGGAGTPGLVHPGYGATLYYTAPYVSALTTTLGVANRVYYHMLIVDNGPITIATIGVDISTGGAAGTRVRLGLYTNNRGKPDQVITEFGNVAGDAIAFASLSPNYVLQPGRYWVAIHTEGGPTFRAANTVNRGNELGWTTTANPTGTYYLEIKAYGALAAANAPSIQNAGFPLAFIQVAA